MTLGTDWTIWAPSYIKVILRFLEALVTYSSFGCESTRGLCFEAFWIKYLLKSIHELHRSPGREDLGLAQILPPKM